jgi:hypothetical protein
MNQAERFYNYYDRAGKPICPEPLGAEWLSVVKELLG